MDVTTSGRGRFQTYLNDQVAASDVLVVIGPNWLRVKDKADSATHQQTILCHRNRGWPRDIRVIPVLVEGHACRRRAIFRSLPLARRQVVEMRHAHFGKDASGPRMGEAR
jgi:hypothetical protein